mgnify:CR=1 FL=1
MATSRKSLLTGLMKRNAIRTEAFPNAKAFLKDLGVDDSGVSSLIKGTYDLLGLMTYFTAGEKEVRAWAVPVGATAPQAAGVIHTDFEKGFIRAEVISWDKLVEAGSIPHARDRGWVRTEGKDYIVQDGDVMNILHSG